MKQSIASRSTAVGFFFSSMTRLNITGNWKTLNFFFTLNKKRIVAMKGSDKLDFEDDDDDDDDSKKSPFLKIAIIVVGVIVLSVAVYFATKYLKKGDEESPGGSNTGATGGSTPPPGPDDDTPPDDDTTPSPNPGLDFTPPYGIIIFKNMNAAQQFKQADESTANSILKGEAESPFGSACNPNTGDHIGYLENEISATPQQVCLLKEGISEITLLSAWSISDIKSIYMGPGYGLKLYTEPCSSVGDVGDDDSAFYIRPQPEPNILNSGDILVLISMKFRDGNTLKCIKVEKS